MHLPITTPSTLGPKAYAKSGACTGADSSASSGRSRKHRSSAGGVSSGGHSYNCCKNFKRELICC